MNKTSRKVKWSTVEVDIDKLRGWDDNPRKITQGELDRLSKNVVDLGNFEPLVVNTDYTVIAGNQRLKVLQQQGAQKVSVSIPSRKLSKREIQKVGVLSNHHAGQWDASKLEAEFGDILNELSMMSLLPEPPRVHEDTYAPDEELVVHVQTGDVWQLGAHRLMCGDSTDPDTYVRLLGDQRAGMIFTDPPYNIAYQGGMHADGTQSKRAPIANDAMSDEDFALFMSAWIEAAKVFNVGAWYICMSSSQLHTLYTAFVGAKLHWHEYIIWAKNNFTLSRSDYQQQFEPILYGLSDELQKKLEKVTDTEGEIILYGWDNHRWYGGRKQGNVWHIDKPARSPLHPTMKPVELCAKAIVNSSRHGEIVLDPFGGGGSTLIACEQTGRACRMVELEERYCQIIINRWEELTGEKAVKIS